MKILIVVLGLLVLIFSNDALATSQRPDRILIEGKTYELYNLPLEEYFNTKRPRPNFYSGRSDTSRGYIATWKIEQGQLYLVGFSGWIAPNPPKDLRSYMRYKLALDNREIGRIVDLDALFPNNQGKVIANWVTGQLRVPQGELLLRRGYAYADEIYERDLLINVIDGQVVNQVLIDNKWKIIKLCKEHPALLRSNDRLKSWYDKIHKGN